MLRPTATNVEVLKNFHLKIFFDNGEIKISTETLNKLSKIKQKKVSD